jgi:hypothetical protein
VRGFEVSRGSYSLHAVIDHVLSRQGAAIELGGVDVRKEVPADLPACAGDIARTDRALAIAIHRILDELAEPREIVIRAFDAGDVVTLEVAARVRAAAPFVETLSAPAAPPELGETLGLRLARGWLEAQGVRLTAIQEGPLVRVSFELPRAAH